MVLSSCPVVRNSLWASLAFYKDQEYAPFSWTLQGWYKGPTLCINLKVNFAPHSEALHRAGEGGCYALFLRRSLYAARQTRGEGLILCVWVVGGMPDSV